MQSASESVARARKGLTIYLSCIVVGSVPLLWRIIAVGLPVEDTRQLPLLIALMWVPALASFVARLVMREGVRDVSFRLAGGRGARAILIAVVFPVATGLIAYGIAWGSPLATFTVPQYGLFPSISSPVLRFSLSVLFAMTAGSLIGVITAAGEEIGWRGYMLGRLVEAGVPNPLVVSGIIWGLWHVPGILSGQYAAGPYPWLSAALFMVLAVSLSTLWGRMRIVTGSVWPAILGHSAWNAVIEGPFTSYTRGSSVTLWLGESGVILSIVVALSVVLLMKSGASWRMRAFQNSVGILREGGEGTAG